MKIIEIKLPPTNIPFYYNTNFNPSIIKVSPHLYLVSFRTFRRYKLALDAQPVQEARVNEPNHPWYGGPNSATWWKGSQGTAFIYLQADTFIASEVIYYLKEVVDSRLFRLDPNTAILTGNTHFPVIPFGRDRPKWKIPTFPGSSNKCSSSHCVGMGSSLLSYDITAHTVQNIKNTPMYPLCNNVSITSDKNWSLFSYNHDLYLSYMLAPEHVILDLDLDDLEECYPRSTGDINIFGQISNYYEGETIFSLSTPALPFDQNTYIGVGHVKFGNPPDRKESNLAKFISSVESTLKSHPLNIYYLMFFYTFDPTTLEILQVSDAFLPPTSEYSLVFPCGLTMADEDTFIVSYGEGDVKMKLLIMTREEIQSMLWDQEMDPAEYDFIKY